MIFTPFVFESVNSRTEIEICNFKRWQKSAKTCVKCGVSGELARDTVHVCRHQSCNVGVCSIFKISKENQEFKNQTIKSIMDFSDSCKELVKRELQLSDNDREFFFIKNGMVLVEKIPKVAAALVTLSEKNCSKSIQTILDFHNKVVISTEFEHGLIYCESASKLLTSVSAQRAIVLLRMYEHTRLRLIDDLSKFLKKIEENQQCVSSGYSVISDQKYYRSYKDTVRIRSRVYNFRSRRRRLL